MFKIIISVLDILGFFFNSNRIKIRKQEKLVNRIKYLKGKKNEALAANNTRLLTRIASELEWLREQKRLLHK